MYFDSVPAANTLVSTSIVNYATPEDTLECLESIESAFNDGSIEMLVWDNAPVASACIANLTFANFRYLRNGKNLGFGGGNNMNLDEARGKYFVILNPDVVVDREALMSAIDILETPDPSGLLPVAVTPLLRNQAGDILPSNRKLPSLRTEFARLFGLDRVPNSKWSTLLVLQPNSGPVAVEQPAGASLICRTDTLRSLGGFDTEFALYFEDVALAKKLSEVGPILVDTDHSFIHSTEGTARKLRKETTFWIERNRVRYHLKHSNPATRWLCVALSLLSSISHGVAWALLSLTRTGQPRIESWSRATGYFLASISWALGSESYWRRRFLDLRQ